MAIMLGSLENSVFIPDDEPGVPANMTCRETRMTPVLGFFSELQLPKTIRTFAVHADQRLRNDQPVQLARRARILLLLYESSELAHGQRRELGRSCYKHRISLLVNEATICKILCFESGSKAYLQFSCSAAPGKNECRGQFFRIRTLCLSIARCTACRLQGTSLMDALPLLFTILLVGYFFSSQPAG